MRKNILKLSVCSVVAVLMCCNVYAVPTVKKLGTATPGLNVAAQKSDGSSNPTRVGSIKAKAPTSQNVTGTISAKPVVSASADSGSVRFGLSPYLHNKYPAKSTGTNPGVASNEFIELKGRVDSAEENIDALTADVEGLTQNVDNVTTNVENLTQNVDSVTTNVENLTQNVDNVTTNVENLTQNVNNVTTNVQEISQNLASVTEIVNALNNNNNTTVTEEEKQYWNAKQAALTAGDGIIISENNVISSGLTAGGGISIASDVVSVKPGKGIEIKDGLVSSVMKLPFGKADNELTIPIWVE